MCQFYLNCGSNSEAWPSSRRVTPSAKTTNLLVSEIWKWELHIHIFQARHGSCLPSASSVQYVFPSQSKVGTVQQLSQYKLGPRTLSAYAGEKLPENQRWVIFLWVTFTDLQLSCFHLSAWQKLPALWLWLPSQFCISSAFQICMKNA